MREAVEHIKVPELRFPDFSGEWEMRKFENLFCFSTGKNIKQNEASPDFKTPCVRYGELYHMYTEIISKVENKTNLSRKDLSFSLGNEILLPSAGEDPLDIGSASALLIPNVAIGRTINILRPKVEGAYSMIFTSYFINSQLRKPIARLAKGVSISNVYNSDLRTLRINLPSLPEQQKIAEFLTAVDETIGKLKRKKELLEAYKKGAMQKLFSQEIRFKDDQGNPYPDWEEKRLGDIGKTYAGLSGKSKEDFGTGVPYVQYMQVFSNNMISLQDCDFVQVAEDEKQNTVQRGDALFTTSSETPADIGTCSVLTVSPPAPLYLNSFCFGFRLNVESNPAFLSFRFHSPDFREKMIPLAQGSTRFNLSKSNFLKLKTTFPSLPEQQKIAEFLTGIDDKIKAVANQIDQAAEFKKGLLQKMFV